MGHGSTEPGGPEAGLAAVRIRLDIGYDGTGFSGWARQPGRRTVQETLEDARARAEPAATGAADRGRPHRRRRPRPGPGRARRPPRGPLGGRRARRGPPAGPAASARRPGAPGRPGPARVRRPVRRALAAVRLPGLR